MWLVWICFFVLTISLENDAASSSISSRDPSIARKSAEKSVLINLAKTLSSSLQKAMNTNNQKIENILGDQQEVMAAVESIEIEVDDLKKNNKKFKDKYEELQEDVKSLKNRRELDEMLWRFNTQVCNASIEMVKQNIDSKIDELKNEEIIQINDEKQEALSDSSFFNLGESFNTDEIFKEFEDALAEYEQDGYEYDMKTDKTIEKDKEDPVSTLVAETNNFLIDLNMKYNNLSEKLSSLHNLTLDPQTNHEQELELKIETKMNKLEAKYDFLLQNLQSIMKGEDDDIRSNIAMRTEDFNVLKKTTSSRLSVYEARINMLEELVLNFSEKSTEVPILEFSATPATTTNRFKTVTTDMVEPDYDDLGGNDFSMLGIRNPNDLDKLQPMNPKQPFPNCINHPCDTNFLPSFDESLDKSFSIPGSILANDSPQLKDKFGRTKRQNVARPPPQQVGIHQIPPPVGTTSFTENKITSLPACHCEELRGKTMELEHEVKFLSAEVSTSLEGMRSTLTTLLHRMEELERQSNNTRSVSCVATKEALNMPGMDGWCSENCRKGNCPSHLCSCPNIII